MKNEKLVTIGEAHVAFVPLESTDSLKTSEHFLKIPGGSPVNVAVAAAKLGARTEFIGRLGKDAFGDFLSELLPAYGVGAQYLSQTPLAPTPVIFRSYLKDDVRFLPQSLTADGCLRPDDLHKDEFEGGDVLYFSAKSLIQNLSKGAIEKAINIAGEKGVTIAFAPQINFDEWPNEILARETILQTIPYAHLLIVNEEELTFLSGKEDTYMAIKKLFGGKTKCMIILRGDKGLTYVTDRDKGTLRYATKEVIDPTGMDDAFIGYLLFDLLENQVTPHQLSAYYKDSFHLEEKLEAALQYREFTAQHRGGLIAVSQVLMDASSVTR